jgi:hypothetical protein
MESKMPIIKVFQLIMKRDPAIVGVIYTKPDDTSDTKYYHNVNIHMDKAHSAEQIVEELQKEETVYFGPHLIKKEQLLNIVKKLFEPSPTKSDDAKKKKSLRDRLQLPLHDKKKQPEPNPDLQKAMEEYQQNSDNENQNEVPNEEYDPSKHNLQRVFIEDANQEFLMDSTGNLFDLDGNCVGKAQYDEEDGKN